MTFLSSFSMSLPSPRKHRESVRNVDWKKRLVYPIGRCVVNLFFTVFYSIRYFGKRNIPDTGPLLVVANHQSLYDPPILGSGIMRRRCNYLARKTLFRFKPFAWLIDLYDAIPLDNEGIGYEGIKETLRRLKNNEVVLLFPEGARTFDGSIGPFKPGFLALALRSKATILPTAVAGCFEAWPRTQKLPNPFGTIRVAFGEPITAGQAAALPEEELHRLVETRIHDLYERLMRRDRGFDG